MPKRTTTTTTRRGGAGGSLGDRFNETFFGRAASPNATRVADLALACLVPNPDQPRQSFDEEGLAELAASIERHGLIHPIAVRPLPDGDRYLIAAGERRFRAFQRLGRATIPAIVVDGDPEELALIENMQRRDLDPLEEAAGMARLMERRGYTQEELGRALGRRQNTVSEILSLNALPEAIKRDYRTSDTRRPVAKAVLIEVARVRDPEAQRRLWEELRRGGASVREARAARRAGDGEGVRPPRRQPPRPPAKVLAAGRLFLRQLEGLPARDLAADRDRYRELLALRDRLDALIRRCAAVVVGHDDGGGGPEEVGRRRRRRVVGERGRRTP